MSPREYLDTTAPFALVVFGIRLPELLRFTPAEWDAVVDQWELQERRADRRVARICMVLAWGHGNPAAVEEDFIPLTQQEINERDLIASEDLLTAFINSTGSAPPKRHGN